MAEDFVAYSLAHHPAPHRQRIGAGALAYAVFAAPLLCGLDLVIDYALVGHACYPGDEPLSAPFHGFSGVWLGVLAIHLVTLVLILSGGWVAWRIWARTGPPRSHTHHLLERGEGRDRFLGIVGMAFAVMFFGITAAETVGMAMVRLCAY